MNVGLTGIAGVVPAAYRPSADALKDTADKLRQLDPEKDQDALLQDITVGRRELDKLMQNLDKLLQKPTK